MIMAYLINDAYGDHACYGVNKTLTNNKSCGSKIVWLPLQQQELSRECLNLCQQSGSDNNPWHTFTYRIIIDIVNW